VPAATERRRFWRRLHQSGAFLFLFDAAAEYDWISLRNAASTTGAV